MNNAKRCLNIKQLLSLLFILMMTACTNPFGQLSLFKSTLDEITPLVISFTGATGTTGSINSNMTVVPTTLIANSASITSCSSSPQLPTGLSIDSTTCVISGTPTTSSSATYTITATVNLSHTASDNVTLTISIPPVLSYVGASGTNGLVNNAMTINPTTLTANAPSVTGCTSLPQLPTGLTIDSTTCVISGTPTTSSSATYTITMTNSLGLTASANVTISAVQPPVLSYAGAAGTSATYNVATTITPTTLTANAPSISNCTSSPQLPTGLSINSSTCVITGTSTAISNSDYTITVTNSLGISSSASVRIGVSVPGLQVGSLMHGGVVAYILADGDPGYQAGVVKGFAATSAGLGIYPWGCYGGNANAGGTAIGDGPQNTANIVASCGDVSFAAKVASDLVEGGFDDWFLPSLDELTKMYENRAFLNMGGLEYWASSEFNSIWGRMWLFGYGFHERNPKYVLLNVRPIRNFTASLAPVLSYSLSGGTTGSVGSPMSITPSTLTINAPSLTNCTSSPQLPTGLTISASTCVISGTPTSGVISTYTITATNSLGGSSTATVNLSISSPSYNLGDLAQGGMIAYILQPGDPGYDVNVQHGIVISVDGSNNPNYVGYDGPVQGPGASGAANVSYDSITSADIGSGLTNSNNLIAFVPTVGAGWYASAALIARNFNGGGYTDWALPSLNDILAMRSSNIGSINGLWNYQSSTSTTCGWPNYAYIGCFHYYLAWPNPWAYRLMAGWSGSNVVAVRYY
jgi:hypothetical protein